ncbi:GspB domain-containing protein [Wenzhouxiangella sp. XN79A]|uniref:general secretion pathway protein GspB n=1 Tax=Wenzhouxiangella sp. XN79A TaxID=2724193 RepID=UPI00144A69B3|nr:general secretion pathway protein GspB [Wenzhouxiangella sp. XN79A]NKI35543.1 GspB domain-containing protein [Wenzhouxiangella sp. XN79A]
MSLLLDALRKSEQRRQRSSSPPLGLPTGPSAGRSAPPPGRFGRRTMLLLLAALVVAAAAWWMLGAPGLPGGNEPAPANGSSLASAPAVVATPDERALRADAYRRPPAVEAVQDPAPTVAAAETMRRAAEPDAPGPEAAGPAPDRLAGRNDSGPGVVPAGAAEPPPPAEPERAGRWSEPSRSQPPDLSPESAAPVGPNASASPPIPADPAVRDPRANAINPWELPAALRGEFPDIDLAVHVFASDPAARFVLIGGERYGEGDTVAEGVRLAEIRRGGVVVEFRDYRIWIE